MKAGGVIVYKGNGIYFFSTSETIPVSTERSLLDNGNLHKSFNMCTAQDTIPVGQYPQLLSSWN